MFSLIQEEHISVPSTSRFHLNVILRCHNGTDTADSAGRVRQTLLRSVGSVGLTSTAVCTDATTLHLFASERPPQES